jgi:hypothetical protein
MFDFCSNIERSMFATDHKPAQTTGLLRWIGGVCRLQAPCSRTIMQQQPSPLPAAGGKANFYKFIKLKRLQSIGGQADL